MLSFRTTSLYNISMNDIKKVIAKNLSDLRKRKKYTQQELGDMLGYSDKAISKREKGESLPDIEVIFELAQLYGVTLDFLTTEGNYDDKKDLVLPKYEKRNKIIITLLFSTLIWFLVLMIFVYFTMIHIIYWPVFIYGIPLNALILYGFNLKWGKKIFNLPILSILNWGIVISLYLTFVYFNTNFRPIILLGIPVQIAVILWSQIKHDA